MSFDDGALIVRILHIDDSVSTECDSAAQAQTVFEDLVEDYLETCAAVGKEPNKPFRGSFNVRVGPDLHKRISMAATARGDSLNAWIISALEEKLEKHMHSDLPNIQEISELLRLKNVEAIENYTPRSALDLFGSLNTPRTIEIARFTDRMMPVLSVEGIYEH